MPKQEAHIDFSYLADPFTETILLPERWCERDNSRRVKHYKRALRQGIHRRLNDKQQELIRLYYDNGMSKSEIAQQQGTTCSAVGKSLQTAELALQDYVELYMDIYIQLERELMDREEGR